MYFDSAATTPLDPRVCDEMRAVMDMFGNENSKHHYGFEARKKMDQYLKKIAKILAVSSDQIFPVYSATDANRRSVQWAQKNFGIDRVFCSHTEHSSIADEINPQHCFDPTDHGIGELALKNPGFIALAHANSETGHVYSVEKYRKNFPSAIILRDYVQSFAKGVKPDFENADIGTFAPHKFHGPKMVGLVYLKNPEAFPEFSNDTHTKNLFLVAGMAKAFEIHTEEYEKNRQKMVDWSVQISEFIEENIADYRLHSHYNGEHLPGLINVAFRGIRGGELMMALSEKEGIAVSTGSACTSDILSPTRIIQFLESDPVWQYPIRIGLHKFLTDQNIADFCEILAHYVGEMRSKRGS